MLETHRWDDAIIHHGDQLDDFVHTYFDDPQRSVLLVAGVGFDPRTTLFADLLSTATAAKVSALYVREQRADADDTPELVGSAMRNLNQLRRAIPDHEEVSIDVFEADGTVTGGRKAAKMLSSRSLDRYSDVVIDLSAMSVGVSFPMVKFLFATAQVSNRTLQVHVVVAHDPALDSQIRATAADKPNYAHGFNGRMALTDSFEEPTKLWLPQLATGRSSTLRRIHDALRPDEVCPILPFPARDPRRGDNLLCELLTPAGAPWVDVDARSIVYADEGDPLDLYRTILRLHDLREPVFREYGGSRLVLSPLGSKVMALGALMAALDLDLPVMYIEDFSYTYHPSDSAPPEPTLIHIWLERREAPVADETDEACE